jgi:hypothetical protein
MLTNGVLLRSGRTYKDTMQTPLRIRFDDSRRQFVSRFYTLVKKYA